MSNIFLIGFMGAGKSTIGRLLAEKANMTAIDFDEQIEKQAGCSIQSYFQQYGEEAFRKLEHETLRDFTADQHVVATGGGIILKEENRQLLKELDQVVYLQTDPDVLYQRLSEDEENVRPLVLSKSKEEVLAIYEPRIPLYKESATLMIDTTDRTPEDIATEILQKLAAKND